jgi:hypothetical protein
MTEVGTMDIEDNKGQYDTFIREAFIDPIRSVFVVDDKFPTLAGLLDGKEIKDAEVENLKKIIQLCRDPKKNWMLDVHNGEYSTDTSGVEVSGLHQSDLLILDYNLDGGDDPTRSIDILHDVAKNEHFNLVVVYSQQDPIEVFINILSTFLSPWKDANGDDPDDDVIDDIVQVFGKDAIKTLVDSITLGTYLNLRQDNLTSLRNPNTIRYLAEFQNVYAKYSKEVNWNIDDCFKWVLRQIEKENEITQSIDHSLNWRFKESDDKSWLRTDRLFLTVVKKDAEEVIDGLEKALIAWKPSPNRLIVTKIRNELEAHGVSAENKALMDSVLQCGWLENVRNAKEGEKIVQIEGLIERNTSGLFSAIWNEVSNFTHKILSELDASNIKSTTFFGMKSFPESEQRKAILRHNANVSSTFIYGDYMNTGHILRIGNDLWICSTPPCDLVPGRDKDREKLKILSPATPFKALKLHPISESNALKYATSGQCVFLDLSGDGEIKTFHIRKDGDQSAAPEWEEMLAANEGRFFPSNKRIKIGRIDILSEVSAEELAAASLEKRPSLTIDWSETEIISQLRYNYAMPLLNSLGQSITRIGLDFIGVKKSN